MPQPGDFYGGWVTPNLDVQIKGAPGTKHWEGVLHRSGCNHGIPKFRGPFFTLWMAHRTPSPAETAAPKPKYRVANLSDYYRALVSRGEVTLWIDEALPNQPQSGDAFVEDLTVQPEATVGFSRIG